MDDLCLEIKMFVIENSFASSMLWRFCMLYI